jgi:hypothetical protein
LRDSATLHLLLTAIGLTPVGSVYKDHTFNKETTPTSHETARYSSRIFTVQYKYIYITKHGRKQKNTEENKMNILPGNEPGPSSL